MCRPESVRNCIITAQQRGLSVGLYERKREAAVAQIQNRDKGAEDSQRKLALAYELQGVLQGSTARDAVILIECMRLSLTSKSSVPLVICL